MIEDDYCSQFWWKVFAYLHNVFLYNPLDTQMIAPINTVVQVSGITKVRFNGFAGLSAEGNQVQKSAEFTCLGHQWCLILYPGGRRNAAAGMVSVYLHGQSDKSINIECTIIIKNCQELRMLYNCVSYQTRGWPSFAMRSKVLESLQDGALVMEVHTKLVDPTEPIPPFIPKNPSACEVIQAMFMDEESSDVVIEVGESPFYAHRFVVQNCSTILAQLCKSASGKIELSDVSPEIFRHLLKYMYGGEVVDVMFHSHAKEIIDAADKYGVVNLKLEAEVRFVEATTFTMDNVMDHLLYAESKNCALLKEAAMDFIAENKFEAMKKLSFKDAPGTLMGDLLIAVVRGEQNGETDKNGNNDPSMMRISELRQKAHLKRLNVDGSRETLIASLKQLEEEGEE